MASKKISQTDIGRAIGKDNATVHKWIKYDRIPTADYALKIADLLEVDIRYLVTGEKEDTEALKAVLAKPELRKLIEMLKFQDSADIIKAIKVLEACGLGSQGTAAPERKATG